MRRLIGVGAVVLAACSGSQTGDAGPLGGTDDAGPVGVDGGRDAGVTRVTLRGGVAKGPFVLGSSVTVSPLDAMGEPTGMVFKTNTIDDEGRFQLSFSYQGPVALEGNGYYFNESSRALSLGPLTLNALGHITSTGTQSAFVNILTHLTFQRAKLLFSEGLTVEEATALAEAELHAALPIGGRQFTPDAAGIEMNMLGADTDANAYVFAVSAVFAVAGGTDARIQELLNTTALAFAPLGTLPPALVSTLTDVERSLSPRQMTGAMIARLIAIQSSAVLPDLDRALDTDGDGVPNRSDSCAFVPNPAQAPVLHALCGYAYGQYSGPSLGSGQWFQANLAIDADGDGARDLLAVGEPYSLVFFARDGGLVAGAPFELNLSTYARRRFRAGDLNGDGVEDLVVATEDSMQRETIRIFQSDGGGGFASPVVLTGVSTLYIAQTFELGDLNDDGRLDVVAEGHGTRAAPPPDGGYSTSRRASGSSRWMGGGRARFSPWTGALRTSG